MSFNKFLDLKGIKANEASMDNFLSYKEVDREKLGANDAANLYDEFQSFMRKSLEEKIEGKASKQDIEILKGHILKQQEQQIDSLKDILKNQGTLLNDLQREKAFGTNGEIAQDFSTQLVASFRTENAEAFKAWKEDGKQFKMNLELKVPGTMTGANISGGDVPQAQRLPGFDIVPSRVVRVPQLCQQRVSSSNKVEWVYQSAKA